MTERTRAGDAESELLDDLRYLWGSQGPAGQSRGLNALEELLWRWEFLPFGWWEKSEEMRTELMLEMPNEQAVASIAIEAERRGYEHDLLLDKEW